MIDLFNQLEIGMIFKKKVNTGFRGIGSEIKIIDIKNCYVVCEYLPKNKTALLGNETLSIGKQKLFEMYEKTIH